MERDDVISFQLYCIFILLAPIKRWQKILNYTQELLNEKYLSSQKF